MRRPSISDEAIFVAIVVIAACVVFVATHLREVRMAVLRIADRVAPEHSPVQDLRVATDETSRRVLLIVFSKRNAGEAEHLVASIAKNAPALLTILAVGVSDAASHEFADRHGFRKVELPDAKVEGSFQSAGMNTFVRNKFRAILQELRANKEVLYLDTDIVVFRDPWEELQDIAVNDLMGQDDGLTCAPGDTYKEKGGDAFYAEMCTGVLIARPTPAAIEAFERALRDMEASSPPIDDQTALNNVLKKMHSEGRIAMRLLDKRVFPNGSAYFFKVSRCEPIRNPVLVHNNYMIGIVNKRERLSDAGLLMFRYR